MMTRQRPRRSKPHVLVSVLLPLVTPIASAILLTLCSLSAVQSMDSTQPAAAPSSTVSSTYILSPTTTTASIEISRSLLSRDRLPAAASFHRPSIERPITHQPARRHVPTPKPIAACYIKVLPGDTLIKIAAQYGSSPLQIKRLNPQRIKHINLIYVGERLKVSHAANCTALHPTARHSTTTHIKVAKKHTAHKSIRTSTTTRQHRPTRSSHAHSSLHGHLPSRSVSHTTVTHPRKRLHVRGVAQHVQSSTKPRKHPHPKPRKQAAHKAHRSDSHVSKQTSSGSMSHIQLMKAAHIRSSDYGSANKIIIRESGWHVHAVNPKSGAYGLCQALPGRKMAHSGTDWRNNPITQLRWCNSYALQRYHGWHHAWKVWHKFGWW